MDRRAYSSTSSQSSPSHLLGESSGSFFSAPQKKFLPPHLPSAHSLSCRPLLLRMESPSTVDVVSPWDVPSLSRGHPWRDSKMLFYPHQSPCSLNSLLHPTVTPQHAHTPEIKQWEVTPGERKGKRCRFLSRKTGYL